jgi:transcriptional regulator with XRE-family HTH domain
MAIVTDEKIGALVRAKRLEKEVSQPDLAKALRVSPMMVQHYETGRNPLTVVKLSIIARKLGCEIMDLIP